AFEDAVTYAEKFPNLLQWVFSAQHLVTSESLAHLARACPLITHMDTSHIAHSWLCQAEVYTNMLQYWPNLRSLSVTESSVLAGVDLSCLAELRMWGELCIDIQSHSLRILEAACCSSIPNLLKNCPNLSELIVKGSTVTFELHSAHLHTLAVEGVACKGALDHCMALTDLDVDWILHPRERGTTHDDTEDDESRLTSSLHTLADNVQSLQGQGDSSSSRAVWPRSRDTDERNGIQRGSQRNGMLDTASTGSATAGEVSADTNRVDRNIHSYLHPSIQTLTYRGILLKSRMLECFPNICRLVCPSIDTQLEAGFHSIALTSITLEAAMPKNYSLPHLESLTCSNSVGRLRLPALTLLHVYSFYSKRALVETIASCPLLSIICTIHGNPWNSVNPWVHPSNKIWQEIRDLEHSRNVRFVVSGWNRGIMPDEFEQMRKEYRVGYTAEWIER
ncbi:hypothetical protein SARC_06076, partial [Sphaeroforma arctica JP610]